MDCIKKHKTLWQATAIFLGSLLIFWLLWGGLVQNYRQNRMTIYLQPENETTTLPKADAYTQTFQSDSSFITLALAPAAEDKAAGQPTAPNGKLPAITLYDGQGNLLGHATASQTVLDKTDDPLDGYYLFAFDAPITSPNGWYQLHLQPNGTAFGASEKVPTGWALSQDGKRQVGSLCLAVTTPPIGHFVDAFFAVFALLISAAAACLFWAMHKKGRPLHTLFALYAAVLGLLYCFALPPYAAPDEQFHINQTFNISSAMLGQGPWQVPWGSNYKRASDSDTLVEDYNNTSFTYQRLGRDFFTQATDSASQKMQGEEVGGYRLIYWPAALAVSLCRVLGAGFVPTLYAGRLANLALYVLLSSRAVKLAPFGQSIFAAVPLLPMSLHLAASFSRDSLTIGLYLLYLSLCLHYTFAKKTVAMRDITLLLFISFLAAPAKAVYAPLLLLCLAIPPDKLRWHNKPLAKKAAYALLGTVVCVGALSFAWQGGGAIVQQAATQVPVPVVTRASGGTGGTSGGSGTATQKPAATALEIADAGFNPDAITYSIPDIFKRPFTIAQLSLRTLAENTTFYVQTLLGGNLSYFTLPISWLLVIPLALLLLAASLPTPGQLRPKASWQLFAAFLVVCAAGLVFVGCITWTPTYHSTIYGVQGRYFLPMLPLALCALLPLWHKVITPRNIARPLLYLQALFALGVLTNATLGILSR